MTSTDSNILLYALDATSRFHASARRFLAEHVGSSDFAISEFVLVEYYILLRNPAVLAKPLDEAEAVAEVETYRTHPRWKLTGFPPDSKRLHQRLWQLAANKPFARRRIIDARTALSLLSLGVTDFATANVADFEGLGFRRVWNPLGAG